LVSVRSEIAGFGSGQGLSVFATAGIVYLFRGLQKSENAALGQKMPFPDEHYPLGNMSRMDFLSDLEIRCACLNDRLRLVVFFPSI